MNILEVQSRLRMHGQIKSQVPQSRVCIRRSFSAGVFSSFSPTFCALVQVNDSCPIPLIGRWQSPPVRPAQHVKLNTSHLH